MPVLQTSRQLEALAWFDGPRGKPLLAAEVSMIHAALASRPAQQPWLWLAPLASEADLAEGAPRCLRLYRQGDLFSGDTRCGLPLPLPTEAIGNIILQHALDDGMDELLEECARVLEPGGRLWLFTLNAWSPYRARWRYSGLMTRDAPNWRQRLRDLGLQPCGGEVTYLGPVWRMNSGSQARVPGRLRAVCLLEAEKRTAALIPPTPVKRQWQTGTASA
ncbi:MAG TPA: hypothetical protein VIT22_05255 [Pseudoxanthomonas sp.]